MTPPKPLIGWRDNGGARPPKTQQGDIRITLYSTLYSYLILLNKFIHFRDLETFTKA